MPTVRYEDLLGYKFFSIHEFGLKVLGVRPDIEPGDRRFLVKAAEYFGIFMAVVIILQGIATSMVAHDCLMAQDYTAVCNIIAYVSFTLSFLNKYQILRAHSTVIRRLGLWMIKVKSERGAEVPRIESVVLRLSKSLYYLTIAASIVWAVVPMIQTTPLVPTTVPYLEDRVSYAISYPYIQVPSNLFFTCTIVFIASSVIHTMSVFCSEVRSLGDRWTNVMFDSKNPGHFKTVMKDCVARHKQLLNVMKDLNTIFDSLFAFQIMIFIAHFCAFNFCLLKTTKSEAMAPFFPLIFMSSMEFGLLCWLGEESTHALEKFHWKVYNTNWYESQISDKKNLVFVLENLKQRRYFTGASLVPASLSTYVEALRQAFSLYTLMKALTTKE